MAQALGTDGPLARSRIVRDAPFQQSGRIRMSGVVQNRLFLGNRLRTGSGGVMGSLQYHRKMQRAGA